MNRLVQWFTGSSVHWFRQSVFGIAFLATVGAGAKSETGPPGKAAFPVPEEHPVDVRLVTEHAAIVPGGSTRVGVQFILEEGWHIYGQQPGDAGLPTQIAWSAPQGVDVTPLSWPLTKRFLDPGDIETFGYEREVLLPSAVRVAPNAAVPSDVVLQASIRWLACHEICIPGAAELKLPLAIRTTTDPSPDAAMFQAP